ncbi:DUF2306 domain-containing protein [Paucibacter sp. APW11]|uniref:DUF2306 domain-containing protein n=1 Tax=Roseateles aquae TaxID=3077235 RepID=A0ABU3PAB8_9BURK|nr:DUF2306 domain-containing protein [Paucibacter sp. APW11]MDT8999516.1 DUF2306 domain-containing protein [Paucibacter sp. APW11]
MLRTLRHCLLVFLCLAVVAYTVYVYGVLPLGAMMNPTMRANFEHNWLGIYTHVFASSLALLLGPLQFSARLRAARPRLHRWLGRTYLGVGIGLGGLAGLYMAAHAYGGFWARSGFALLALAWLYTGWQAYSAARARDISSHRRWMLRNFALTLAAVSLRVLIPLSQIGGIPFSLAYPAIAWLCWVPNALLAEALLRRQSSQRRGSGLSAAATARATQ